jgi:coenzyme F420-0:L-glutamate ligase / coenzyme F420-1:gamma-L-glutamate ligase
MPLTLTPLSDISLIRPGDNLADIILNALHATNIELADDDILVLAQKIVSKAEGRLVDLATVSPSQKAINLAIRAEKDPRVVELILQESNEVLRVRPGTIIVEHKLGFVCASAGIDHSNVDPRSNDFSRQEQATEVAATNEFVLLLPQDPDHSAVELRAKIESNGGKRIGVMIIDSHGRAWRLGVVGTCIGLSGLPGIVDKRGDPDLFGYRLRITLIAVADELAAAASLVMGQADEGTPVVHVRGFPYPLREGSLKELLRDKGQDMFR